MPATFNEQKLIMGNKGFFAGRIAKTRTFSDGGKTPVCYFMLIANEYAGFGDKARERSWN